MKQGDKGVPRDEVDYGGMLAFNVIDEERNKLLSNNAFSKYNNDLTIMNFFKDGERRIDFVLAYVKSDGDDGKTNKFKIYRETYLAQLKKKGLLLEDAQPTNNSDHNLFKHQRYVSFRRKKGESVEENDFTVKCQPEHSYRPLAEKKPSSPICYIKVHAPFDVLCDRAEDMRLKMPMTENDIDIKSWFEKPPLKQIYLLFKRFDPFELEKRYSREEKKYFVGTFDKCRLPEFINHDKPDLFFLPAERSRIVYSILEETKYGSQEAEVGINNLQKIGAFIDAYPLHDGPVWTSSNEPPSNDRQRLQADWATIKCLFKYQPINAIKDYFGEEVALYFSWLGFYTSFLLPAAIVGIFCFLYGVTSVQNYTPVKEICDGSQDSSGNHLYYMCPECDKTCCYYLLETTGCLYARISHYFDNEGTVFFALFMSIWATVFLEFWKRKQITSAYHWHSIGFEKGIEQVRPEYNATVKKMRKNPVTLKQEPYMPKRQRVSRICGTFSIVFFFTTLIIVTIVGVIIFRAAFIVFLVKDGTTVNNESRQRSKLIMSVCAGGLNLIAINVLKFVYEKVAVRLTDWENPRTKKGYHDSFTIKMFWFQFFNTYSSIIYIAFFKSDIIGGRPGKYNRFGSSNIRFLGCSLQGCFLELTVQLAIIMVGQQVFDNVIEVLIPFIMKKYNKWKTRKTRTYKSADAQWVEDFQLEMQTKFSLFWQYEEIVLQYGFVTMFVAAFPLAPLFALLNNIAEIRVDAINFVHNFRRPVPLKAEDIGAWYGILATLTTFSTIVNAFLIAFTSNLIPRMTYMYYKSNDGTMNGFTNFTLSYFNVDDFSDISRPNNASCNGLKAQQFCRYPGFYESTSPYNRSHDYWVILCARLSFIIAFQFVVLGITWVIAYIIPDVPKALELKIKREEYLAGEAEKDHKERIGKRKPREKGEINEEDDYEERFMTVL